MSDEDLNNEDLIVDGLANILAELAMANIEDRLEGLSEEEANMLIEASVEEEFSRVKRSLQLPSELPAIEEQQRIMAKIYPADWYYPDQCGHHSTLVDTTSETTVEFTLPPLKPIPKVDQAEIDAINRRVSDPSEQDRLAKEFMEQYVKRRKDV